MKSDIHPKWYPNATVNCACGNTFSVGAAKDKIQVDICNKCHPFFTGEMKFVDTMGRVERFQVKQQKAQAAGPYVSKKAKKAKKAKAEDKAPKSLKEMLLGLR